MLKINKDIQVEDFYTGEAVEVTEELIKSLLKEVRKQERETEKYEEQLRDEGVTTNVVEVTSRIRRK